MIEPVLLTRKQVMEMLGGVSYATLNKLIAAGTLPPSVLIGSRERWDRGAVIEHLKRRVGDQKIADARERATAA